VSGALAAAGCGLGDSLVGGACAAGYALDGDRCVPAADAGDAATDDATTTDGSDADATTDAGDAAAAAFDATAGDGSMTDDGSADDGSVNNDGATADGADANDGPSCPAGEQLCGGGCTDTTIDPLNCGGCGVVCPSQICSQSACVGTTPGGVVFIGHDYMATVPGTSQARVLANAVFLGPPRGAALDDLEVLSYERFANPTALGNIKQILTAATPTGHTLHVTSTQNDADVAALSLATYSVLLVPDQSGSGSTDLAALGATWASALATFTQSGGIVVVLDGGTGAGRMPELVTATQLLGVTSQAPLLAGTPVAVWAPGDAVAVRVTNPYAAGSNSVTVTTEANGGNVVYVVGPPTDAALAPVVVHKVF
jgi:hypothetical protein